MPLKPNVVYRARCTGSVEKKLYNFGASPPGPQTEIVSMLDVCLDVDSKHILNIEVVGQYPIGTQFKVVIANDVSREAAELIINTEKEQQRKIQP